MNNRYFDKKDTLYNITEKYKQSIKILVSLGFDKIEDDNLRKSFGSNISLEDALRLKKIDINMFEKELIKEIENNDDINSQISKDKYKNKIDIVGVLPCPVRFPLMECFEEFIDKTELDFKVEYDLKPASAGLDWLISKFDKNTEEALPDLFISAGFDLFFSENLFGKYTSKQIYGDITKLVRYNKDFENDYINLKDPNNQYSILGVVPAVFLINKDELNGRNIPNSWEDILKDEFIDSVSLPVGDFDLFNAILLNIYKKFGEDGIIKLRKILKKSMHPSEMVKSHIKPGEKPAVTIMPYFFTKMIKENSPMVAVWPIDGAIISPIFMLSKLNKKDMLKPVVDFFTSEQVGRILSHNGKFPSVNPRVDNNIDNTNKYMWLGWDYIKQHDINSLIKRCEKIFNYNI